eukprot:TRINITY_DN24081_c0_g1_i1.p1 TRINITY_DN24081_c0_g1~~TRINITY_DN24081_c0_g1_i1.p1  ORF type:complete len:491 (+),score=82.84 TRINITY_DN24081_c0_g1_i1:58-1530(+)
MGKKASSSKTPVEVKTSDGEDQSIAGGNLIPFLLDVVVPGLAKLNFKLSFWVIVAAVALLYSFFMAFVIVIAGFFAIAASWKQPANPFHPCSTDLDVMLGRTVRVSTLEPEHLHANNNVSLCIFGDKYVLSYRKSDIHFPSGASHLIVAVSTDMIHWEETWDYHTGNDLREMLLFEFGGKLYQYFFSLVPVKRMFKPIHMYCTTSTDAKVWEEPFQVCRDKEVPWDIKVYKEGDSQVAYKASYIGDHYGTDEVWVLFEKSTDAITWKPLGDDAVVYKGGICEVAFEFTRKGDLVAIGRNEDGDSTGFGSQLFFAKKESLGKWTPLKVSLPWRFDSPRMMRTDGTGEILLFSRYAAARYDLAPTSLEFNKQKTANLILYSTLPKTAAIFRIVPPEEWESLSGKENVDSLSGQPMFKGGADSLKYVELVRRFEEAFADTGFFSIVRDLSSSPGKDEWVVANYSAHSHSHAPWIYGQLTRTDVNVCRCRIVNG